MNYTTVTARQPLSDGEYCYLALNVEWETAWDTNPCKAQGETPEEARENLVEVLDLCIEHCREFNLPVPQPHVWKPGEVFWFDMEDVRGGWR
jgi:predicted RNase H-like HicB family nuclease